MASKAFVNDKANAVKDFCTQLKEVTKALRDEKLNNDGKVYSENEKEWETISSLIESVSEVLADLDAEINDKVPQRCV